VIKKASMVVYRYRYFWDGVTGKGDFFWKNWEDSNKMV